MANEARVFAEGVDQVIVRQFTVADATAIPKGSLLVASGNRTGLIHTAADNHKPLGYTTMSKTASDGITEVGCQRTGVVVAYVDGAVSTGDIVLASLTTINRLQTLALRGGGVFSRYELLQAMAGRSLDNIATTAAGRIALSLG